LIHVGARPGARIERILVSAGDTVENGATLAVLEGHEAATAQLALAQAQKRKLEFDLALRKDQLALERESFDEDSQRRVDDLKKLIDEQKANLKQLAATRAALAQANTTWIRLADQDYVVNQLQTDILQREGALKELEKSLKYLPRKRSLEDDELADDSPARALADRQVALAQAQLDQTLVRAPRAGEVLEVLAHEGEISGGPLLYLGDLSTMVARAEVYQQDVANLEVGDPADVLLFDRPLPGEVTRIGKLVLPNQLTSLDPTARIDRRVVPVTIRLKDSSWASSFVNMQVEVAVKPPQTRPK
jgi:HlyD family secretion protein